MDAERYPAYLRSPKRAGALMATGVALLPDRVRKRQRLLRHVFACLAVFSVTWRGTPGTQFLCPPLAGSCSPHIIIVWRRNCQRPERVFSHPIKSEFRNPKDQFGIWCLGFAIYALGAFNVLRPNWRQSLPLPPVERQEMSLTPFHIAPAVPLPEHRLPPLQKPTHRELA